MVPEVNPVILLVNGDVVPSVVLELAVVGPVVVLQHTPCAVTAEPPIAVTVPPELAEVPVIEVIAVVVTVGATANVVKVISLP